MSTEALLFLCAGTAFMGFLYSSVGHAGASGYIAVMALFGLAPTAIKPTALVLNILVACIASWQFWKEGYFSWKLFWPFAIASVPMAFLGGYISLPAPVLKAIIGIVLLYSAFWFLMKSKGDEEPHLPKKTLAFSVGGGLGFLSGLTGVGGGIFLTPLLIIMKWARTKNASAVSALFILANSISGLAGNFSSTKELPIVAVPIAFSAIAGGSAGSYFGSRHFSANLMKKFLAVVLFIAGAKLIFP